MAPRPHWKGYLKLSLVSCPIALYPAISAAERVSFRQVNRATGNRLRHQLVDSVTGEPVQPHDKGRGYEVGENRFLLVEDAELEAARPAPLPAPEEEPEPDEPPVRTAARGAPAAPVRAAAPARAAPPPPEPAPPPPPPPRPENTRTIEIERFVPRTQIDPGYFDKPYYVALRDQVGQEAFAVIRDAMRGKQMMGLGHVVLAARERPIALEPMGKGLRAITLRHLHEVRSDAEYFSDIPDIVLPPEMLRIAEHILDTKAGDFDPAFLTDRYRAALVQMLREKQAALPQTFAPAAPSQENVVDLMDVLRRSLEAERPGLQNPPPRRAASAKPTPSKRSSARTRRAG